MIIKIINIQKVLNCNVYGNLCEKNYLFRHNTDLIKRGDIFICIKGMKRHGFDFIQKAIKQGAGAVLTDHFDHKHYDIPIILVNDSLDAIKKLALLNMRSLKPTVISITGSIGKTTTKDLIFCILEKFFTTSCAESSFNNDIGVPLTLLNCDNNAKFLITEIGTNNPGEIYQLSKITNPFISVITAIGHAHIGKFGSIENIAKEKSSIIKNTKKDGFVIINRDCNFYDFLLQEAKNNNIKNIISFGFSKEADFSISYEDDLTIINNKNNGNTIKIKKTDKGKDLSSAIAFAIISNTVKDFKNYYIEKIINNFSPVKGRNELFEIKQKNIKILDGSYNSSLESVLLFIDKIKNCQKNYRKVFILGSISEIEGHEEIIYQKIYEKIKELDIVILVGKCSNHLKNNVFKEKIIFKDKSNLQEDIHKIVKEGDFIAIKGSNSEKLFNIVEFMKSDDFLNKI
ncbi:UDP-N-acetylmuramoyl-tripeptide--D-alanyl-D-alanine ligase [Anaplasmataceae bacterium AB001_6]|nr:UDP-N-acetylmuramoyl-tripeptide--D-alanyl-D-alanine ligase [Anaplasmataceae bacterium AB001_6]